MRGLGLGLGVSWCWIWGLRLGLSLDLGYEGWIQGQEVRLALRVRVRSRT